MGSFEQAAPAGRDGGEGGSRGRVLLVAPQPFYEDRGTPIAVRQVLEALSQLGYAVDVLTYPIGESPEIPGVRYFRSGNPLGIESVPIGFSLRKLVLDGTLVPALRDRLRSTRYTCVHAVEEAAFPAVWLARKQGIPVIYDMQSSLPEQMCRSAAFRPRPVRALLDRCERWVLENAQLVVSSTGLADKVRERAPETAVSEWQFVGQVPSAGEERIAQLRNELRIAADAKVVMYTGTFEAYQGIAQLLGAVPEVCAGVPEAVFVLVGADAPTQQEVVRQSRILGLNGHIRVVARQPRENIPAYLAMADVLVSPRAYGGNLPLKIFDYLAAGRPIVASDIPTHRSVLNDERAVLVAPAAPDLARALTGVLNNPARAASLAAAARRYADENLAWLPFVQNVGSIYGQVVCGAARE